MIESVCTVLNDGQDIHVLDNMNMEIYVHVREVSPLSIYLDMTGTTYW